MFHRNFAVVVVSLLSLNACSSADGLDGEDDSIETGSTTEAGGSSSWPRFDTVCELATQSCGANAFATHVSTVADSTNVTYTFAAGVETIELADNCVSTNSCRDLDFSIADEWLVVYRDAEVMLYDAFRESDGAVWNMYGDQTAYSSLDELAIDLAAVEVDPETCEPVAPCESPVMYARD